MTTAICPITLEPITDPTKLPCGHEFETKAIDEWCESHNTCPMCRDSPERGQTISNATTIRQEMQEIRNERLRLDRRARELELALMQRHLDSQSSTRTSTPTMRRDQRPSRYKRFRAALDSAGEVITCRILRWGIRTFT